MGIGLTEDWSLVKETRLRIGRYIIVTTNLVKLSRETESWVVCVSCMKLKHTRIRRGKRKKKVFSYDLKLVFAHCRPSGHRIVSKIRGLAITPFFSLDEGGIRVVAMAVKKVGIWKTPCVILLLRRLREFFESSHVNVVSYPFAIYRICRAPFAFIVYLFTSG